MDRGKPVRWLNYRAAGLSVGQGDPEDDPGLDTNHLERYGRQDSDGRQPVDPYRGYFQIHPERIRGDGLLNLASVKRWRNVVSWGIGKQLYTYQQPFDTKAGPTCKLAGRDYRMISSYDYLGLLGHAEIETAAQEAIRRYGTGTGGVRLLTGSTTLHYELDEAIARFKGVEACTTFSSGYIANLAAITALFKAGDRVILDSRAHRSVCDACRMARIQPEMFAHNNVQELEDMLKDSRRSRRTLVVVEGVYSMDGDICPLPEIVSLRRKYGFYLMVDEAHSFGALGANGRGIDEHYGVSPDDVDIWMGSLSKAIPSCGGFIGGSRELIIYLQHGSAPFMFSAAAAPATAAAALAALRILQREPQRVRRLADNALLLRTQLTEMGFDIGSTTSHVIPVILGSDEAAYVFSHGLFRRGTIALGIVSPAVKRGSARLRLCATAAQDREFLLKVMGDFRACRKLLRSETVDAEYVAQDS
jgi:8-amino-7-oxononanoate synthase